MTEKEILMFEKVHDKIHNTYTRLGKQQVSGTQFSRGNFSDVCKILSNMFIFDISEDLDCELNVHDGKVNLIFSTNQKREEE